LTWRIEYSRDAHKFALKLDILSEVNALLNKFLLKSRGADIYLDVKKLEGAWQGFYRIRRGRLRIIFSIEKDRAVLYVERIDSRGAVYRGVRSQSRHREAGWAGRGDLLDPVEIASSQGSSQ
jgi:mRNA interferase RelE/StbE